MMNALANFHLLRPTWLLLIVPAVAIWWLVRRRRDPRRGLGADIAPHLLDHLVQSPQEVSWLRPVTLLLPCWILMVFASAGPAWRVQPSPFAEDSAELYLAVNLSASMLTPDTPPSRLERARNKLHDLLQRREGAPTGLVAYSSSAHLVMPPTEDAAVIEHMLQALAPDVMPGDGDSLVEALELIAQRVNKQGKAASVIVVADGVDPNQIAPLKRWASKQSLVVQVFAVLPDDKATLARSGLEEAAKTLSARLQVMTADDRDITSLAASADNAIVGAGGDGVTQWQDDGYYLLPLVVALSLFWSRRGWSVETD